MGVKYQDEKHKDNAEPDPKTVPIVGIRRIRRF